METEAVIDVFEEVYIKDSGNVCNITEKGEYDFTGFFSGDHTRLIWQRVFFRKLR